MYESYTKPGEWGTLPQDYNKGRNQWVRAGYAYYPIDETLRPPYGTSPVGNVNVPKYTARRFTLLSRKYPYLTDVIWKRKDIAHKAGIDSSDNRIKNAGISALFKDGHVRFVKDEPAWYMAPGRGRIRKQGTVFDNDFWGPWQSKVEDDKDQKGIDARFIFYNIC